MSFDIEILVEVNVFFGCVMFIEWFDVVMVNLLILLVDYVYCEKKVVFIVLNLLFCYVDCKVLLIKLI